MTFRKAGRASISDTLILNQEPLKSTNSFKYLGITLQTRENTFGYHIQEKSVAAIRAIYSLNNLSRLSLDTAMTLFNAVITPIATYGIDLIWEDLTLSDLTKLERIKARFLKCALRVDRTAPSSKGDILC
mgnify:CR=1 FL=1